METRSTEEQEEKTPECDSEKIMQVDGEWDCRSEVVDCSEVSEVSEAPFVCPDCGEKQQQKINLWSH